MNRATLTDPTGLGGIVAQDGFDYQLWDALARVPSWLRNPGFEGMTLESLEDCEARFFAPHAPRGYLLDRFQAKSAQLDRGELVKVFSSFKDFEAAYPHAARVQTLVTPALPNKLAWIARDSERIRRARPFYRPFPDILAASEQKFHDDLVAEFGPEIGPLLADSVEISLRVFPDRSAAEAVFAAAIHEAFPTLDIGPRTAKATFTGLCDLLGQCRGSMVTRTRLLAALQQQSIGQHVRPAQELRLHVRSDRNGAEPDAVEIDASDFSGSNGMFPPVETWNKQLLAPLDATARWARQQSFNRISLTGSYRLSTAFAVGWSFRSAAGFEMEIATRSGQWSTDQHPTGLPGHLSWAMTAPNGLVKGRLVVSVGILRDPRADVRRHLGAPDDADILSAVLPAALTSGTDAQASVQTLKAAVAQAVARLVPTGIDLYIAGPAAFAVTLGHRWNALPCTQVHEFSASNGGYTPSVRVG